MINFAIIRKHNIMPYQMEWLVSERVIIVTLKDDVRVQDLHQLIEDINSNLQVGTPPIHLILVAEDVNTFPTDIQDTYKAFRPIERERMGFFIVVSEDSVLQYITSTTARLIGLRWRTYPKLAAAIDFLTKLDNTLDWGTEQTSC